MADALPKSQELRAMPEAEVQTQLEKLRHDLWQGRLKAREGSLQQTHQLSAMKRQIARILTLLRERR